MFEIFLWVAGIWLGIVWLSRWSFERDARRLKEEHKWKEPS
jgi:hypothetical protein